MDKPTHDTLFLREVIASYLYETRKGSSEREERYGMSFRQDSTTSHTPSSLLTSGSSRDRLNLLAAKIREEERTSGISPELQEIDTLLEELYGKAKEAKNRPPQLEIRSKMPNKRMHKRRK